MSSLISSNGQDHLLKALERLSESEKDKQEQLNKELELIDWEEVKRIREQFLTSDGRFSSQPPKVIETKDVEPLRLNHDIESRSDLTPETVSQYRKLGLEAIAEGSVAALVLAGGQGTRLGSDNPKGTLDVGLGKSLFQYQAERIKYLQKITYSMNDQGGAFIHWYIMTSPATDSKTKKFFNHNDYFGLKPSQVIFFEQDTLPSFNYDGQILLENSHKIAKSPNGNGGLFASIHKNKMIDHMKSKGIKYLHVYCVDNILVRVCDPTFIGFCLSKNADAGSKVVEKKVPEEPVGVICKVKNKYRVIEYSEIPNSIVSQRDEKTNKLIFSAGNICEQFFKVTFLETLKADKDMPYHMAIKKIPHYCLDTKEIVKPNDPNGVKFEKFIFDFLAFTDKFVTWQVERRDEFSPIKNAITSKTDNMQTAKEDLLRNKFRKNLEY